MDAKQIKLPSINDGDRLIGKYGPMQIPPRPRPGLSFGAFMILFAIGVSIAFAILFLSFLFGGHR